MIFSFLLNKFHLNKYLNKNLLYRLNYLLIITLFSTTIWARELPINIFGKVNSIYSYVMILNIFSWILLNLYIFLKEKNLINLKNQF